MLESLLDPVLEGVKLGLAPRDNEDVGVAEFVEDVLASIVLVGVPEPLGVAVPVGDRVSLDEVVGVFEGVESLEPVDVALAP